MKRMKISLMAVAFLFAAGISYATSAPEKARALDCSPTGNLPATLDSALDCPAPRVVFCCILTDGSGTPIFKRS